MIAARRRAQMVLTPVFDDILTATVLKRQAIAAIEGMVGTDTPPTLTIATGWAAAVIPTLPRMTIIVAAVSLSLRDRQSTQTDRQGKNQEDNGLLVHDGLLMAEDELETC